MIVWIISARYLLPFNRYSQRIKYGSLPTFSVLDDISDNKQLIVHCLFGLLTKLIAWNNTTEFVSCCESHINKISVQGTGEVKVRCSFLGCL